MSQTRVHDNNDVPVSERGKGENMEMDRRWPSAVFGLVALSYFAVLLIVLLGVALWFFL